MQTKKPKNPLFSKPEIEIEIEKYPGGIMAIVLGKTLRTKFEEIFSDKLVNVSVGVSTRKIIIVLETAKKQDYIA
jgi:hypothetical protein